MRDATGQPVIDHSVRYWIGPKGTTATEDRQGLGPRRHPSDDRRRRRGEGHARRAHAREGRGHVDDARRALDGAGTRARADDERDGRRATASAELTPEVPAIVPGLTQRMLLTVLDGHGKGIAGAFSVTADGLAANVTTDTHGEAEVTWNAPAGVGATRNVGPCAGGVAAAVVVRPAKAIEVLRSQQEPFTLCLPIDRDAAGVVHVTPDVAKPGEKSASQSRRRAASPSRRTASSFARAIARKRRRRGSTPDPTGRSQESS